MGVESNHEVKKEIQELARTPGRVKEHAQILNKLASSADYKLPMPSVNSSVHSQVVNKIRNGYHGNDSDSGSVQIADSLKKKWIIAASNCDYSELCSLLKEDSNLSSYCDFITGYNALHWAAKFNKPNIIKLIAGKHGVNPNVKSFSGCTPLHLAAQFKNQLIIKLLIESYGKYFLFVRVICQLLIQFHIRRKHRHSRQLWKEAIPLYRTKWKKGKRFRQFVIYQCRESQHQCKQFQCKQYSECYRKLEEQSSK